MKITDLQKRVAEVLGVSSSEKELAFEILISKVSEILIEDITLRVPSIGFFQIRHNEKEDKDSLIFSPMSEDFTRSSRTLYLTIDIPSRFKSENELNADVFSIGIGKPLLPLSKNLHSHTESETSYAILKRSIEERINGLIAESDNLPNFNIWDDYYESLDSKPSESESQMQLIELTSDLEFKDDLIAEKVTSNLLQSEEETIKEDEAEITNESQIETTPTELLADYTPESAQVEREVSSLQSNELEKSEEKILSEEELIVEKETFNEEYDLSQSSEKLQDLLEGYEEELNENSAQPEKTYEKEIEKDSQDILSKVLIDEDDELIDVDKVTEKEEETYLGLKKSVIENIEWNWGDELKEEFGSTSLRQNKSIFEFEDEPDELKAANNTTEEIFKKTKPISSHLFEQLETSIKKELDEATREIQYMEYSSPPPKYEFVEDNYVENYQNSFATNNNSEARYPTASFEKIIRVEEEDFENASEKKNNYFNKSFLLLFSSFIIIASIIIYLLLPNKGTENKTEENISNLVTDSVTTETTTVPIDSSLILVEDESEFPRVASLTVRDRDSNTQPNITSQGVPATPENRPRTIESNELYKTLPTDTRVGKTIYFDGSGYNVQVSSWRNKAKAEQEVKNLKSKGMNSFLLEVYLPQKGGMWYRVRVGGFKSKEEAEDFYTKNF